MLIDFEDFRLPLSPTKALVQFFELRCHQIWCDGRDLRSQVREDPQSKPTIRTSALSAAAVLPLARMACGTIRARALRSLRFCPSIQVVPTYRSFRLVCVVFSSVRLSERTTGINLRILGLLSVSSSGLADISTTQHRNRSAPSIKLHTSYPRLPCNQPT